MTKFLSRAEEIEAALRSALAPRELEVINESHRHAGHAGDDGSGQSHWHVRLRAADLAGLSRIARHRAVHSALGPKLMEEIHALSLDLGG